MYFQCDKGPKYLQGSFIHWSWNMMMEHVNKPLASVWEKPEKSTTHKEHEAGAK